MRHKKMANKKAQRTIPVKLTVLGSGISITQGEGKFRYPSSHLLEVGDYKILLDAGIGVLPQIDKLGIKLTDIDVVCISHYHADHFVLEPILQAFYLYAMKRSQKESLHIIGPSDIEEEVRTEYMTKGWSYNKDLLKRVNLKFTPLVNKYRVNINSQLSIAAYKTKHYQLEAYSYRIETPSAIIAYSGDSTLSPGLQLAANNADLFLCEAAIDIGKPLDQGHLNPYEAAVLAQRANSAKLVFTHYTGNNSVAEIINDARRSGFKGKITVAQDLSSYNV